MCFNIFYATGFLSGCRYKIYIKYGVVVMAYSPTYTSSDFQNIVVDGLGTAGASVVSWISLIVLLAILGLVVGMFMKLGKVFKR